ncbi:hypothetical protein [Sphingobium sp. B12D2B]|uniref:hypothetical protein n=1 Tax=Sphingobium sp. B12D2B TaxID=2940577 RepID=UPI002224DE4F|nr:hypothetical protein [Sphingobium sp. B12D2B]MCW2349803.1 hypothetical protein [Sphingobium sp. B12D2B]
MIKVTLADGRHIEVDTDDPKAAAKIAHEWSVKNPPATLKNRAAGVAGQVLEGVLPGLSGFVRGARETVVNAVQAPFSDKVDFDPVKAYNEGKRFQEGRNRLAAARNSTASNIATGAGLAAGLVLPAKKIAAGANLFQKAKAAATTSGLYGLLSGAMSSDRDTVAGKAEDGVSSGLLSAAVGGAVPAATRMFQTASAPLRPVVQPLIQGAGRAAMAVGRHLPVPPPMARLLVAEGQQLARDPARAAANRALDQALRDAPNPSTGRNFTPREVLSEVNRRQGLGVPAVAADVHEGARRSYAAAARSPGPALASVRRRLDARQEEASSRMASHVAESLGPTANVEAQAAALGREAREAARPLYDTSNATPVPFTPELQELMQRPSARDAVQVAGRQIQDQGEQPHRFGLAVGDDGSIIGTPEPTMALYDRMKTVLDQTIYDGSKPLAAPEVTRASQGAMAIRSRLLQIMDGVDDTAGLNPAWKPARDAYAGPIQNRQAMELGEEMAKEGGEDIQNRLVDLTPSQDEFFRLGHRSGLATDAKQAGDWTNAAARIQGSLTKREGIEAAHGSRASALFDRADAEHEAHQTWKAVRGNSQTADRLAEMAEQDQRLADASTGFIQALAGHPGPGLLNVSRALLKGGGNSSEVKGHVASVLAETDASALRAAMREVGREKARRVLVDRNAGILSQHSGRIAGSLLGTNMIEPLD